MLEGPSFLIARELPSSSEEESKWAHNASRVMEPSGNKRPSEESKELAARKAAKTFNSDEGEANQDHGGDHSHPISLIDQLGRDISITCLLRCSRSDYGALAMINKAFRALIRSGEIYGLRMREGIVEQWVYFSCDLTKWEAFDPIRQRWMHLPPLITNHCFMCSDKESLGIGTELLVFGKEIMSYAVYKYSILTNTWSSGTCMNVPRCLFGSASLGKIAIFAGGCEPCGNISSAAELYNSDTGTWVHLPNMHKARKMSSGVFMDGKFYVIGGIGIDTPKWLTCGEVYDLETETWTEIPNMFPPQNGGAGSSETNASTEAPPLLAVVKNELYAADYALLEVRKYNKINNVWDRLGRLPPQTASMHGWGLAFRGCGDKLIVISESRNMGGGMIELNAWVPDEGPPDWRLLGRRPSGNFVYNCAVMGC